MNAIDIINNCIKVESTAASFYGKLMELFPDHKNFWESLHDEEKEHVSFLNDVKSMGLSDEMEKMESLPATSLIKKSLNLVDNISKKLHDNSITFKEALTLSLELEESMVETYTNRLISELISCNGKDSYDSFVSNEKEHENRIKQMLAKQA